MDASSESAPFYVQAAQIMPGVDVDGDRIEDALQTEIQNRIAEGNGSRLARVVVILATAPTSAHSTLLSMYNGTLIHGPWSQALYGFGATIPYRLIALFDRVCPNLLLVQKDYEYNVSMAYASEQGRARPYVWNTLGLMGDPQSSIAISDTGIDDTSPNSGSYGNLDFSKKIVGWRDDVSSITTPYDDSGHGSHCAGIAAGDGFYTTDASGRAVATWSDSYAYSNGNYIISGFNVSKAGTVTVEVKWDNTGSSGGVSNVYLYYAGYSAKTGSWTQMASVSTPSENTIYTLNYAVTAAMLGYYHVILTIQDARSSNFHILATMHWPYNPPNDGYPAWTGVANDAKLVGIKGLNSAGSGYTSALVNGINWAIANRQAYHILVLSMSWGGNAFDTAINSAVSNAVASGIVCVAAAGNSGTGGNMIHSPGSNPYVISVAATSIDDNITNYSSQGGPSEAASSVVKPDIAAPGGSFYYLPIFSTDSNDQDAGYFSDYYASDSAPMQGTSMSTPFIAGGAAIVAQALGGYPGWNYSSNAKALKVKTLLLMTATETYPNLRELGGTSTSPTLDRGSKDVHEGYGRVNLDAAAEAASITYRTGDIATGSFGATPLDRKCWARNVYLRKGTQYKFNLTVPAGADYDLYLYNMTGNTYGEPIILTKSTTAATGGYENIAYTPSATGSYYIVVKRAREDTGTGQFILSSSPSQSLYLQLSIDQDQATIATGQSLDLMVNVLNQQNPPLDSTLALTITGPNNYYHYDTQKISVAADAAAEYSFTWTVPSTAGTYVIEASTIPTMLTAYDAKWIEVS